jgi:hypothetical protein
MTDPADASNKVCPMCGAAVVSNGKCPSCGEVIPGATCQRHVQPFPLSILQAVMFPAVVIVLVGMLSLVAFFWIKSFLAG